MTTKQQTKGDANVKSYGGSTSDPRWITAKYTGKCRKCSKTLVAGDRVFYYPKGKACYGAACGCAEQAANEFSAMVQDEESK